MPTLSADVVSHLHAAHRLDSKAILVPTFGGRRGHPVLIPWSLRQAVRQLGANEGLNTLLQRPGVTELPVFSASVLEDMDTPDEFQRLRDRS
jgi:molybdenum cofactor cytidylyltransferase